MIHRSRVASGLALVLVLACAERTETVPAVASTGDSTTATTNVTPAGWRVSEMGLGPLLAGMTPAEASAVVPGSFTIKSSAGDSDCQYATWSEAPAGVRVMMVGNSVGRVEIDAPDIETEAGARVGDSEARIDSLYAGRVRRLPHKYSNGSYLIVLAIAPADTMFRLVFETDGSRVTTFRAGRVPPVEYVEGCS